MAQAKTESQSRQKNPRLSGWLRIVRSGAALGVLALGGLWALSCAGPNPESPDPTPPSPVQTSVQTPAGEVAEPTEGSSTSMPPQDYRKATPVPEYQAHMIRGYCAAMYAMRDDGMVDVRELARLDFAAMGAKDAGEYDKELEFNKQAYKLARRLLKDSFAQYLAQGLKDAPPDLQADLQALDGEFQASLGAEDLVSAAAQYHRLLQSVGRP